MSTLRPHASASLFPRWLLPLLAAVLVAADQWLKAWAIQNLELHAPPITAVPGLLNWVLTYNTGAAWSLFSGGAGLLAVGRMLVGVGLLAYLLLRPQPRALSLALTFIAAGAIGNALDGLRQGQVTDMLDFPFLSVVTQAINGTNFPICNLADVFVVGGTFALLLLSFLEGRADRATPEQV
ncbi:signal peptidase II [Deinococcus lacus]|uniref:Lipoprotein signal peptidase n=1 Tax=Deinococcus lacus TaxID=392561 RepID=A0ABW1YC14_9DEIO